MLPLFEQMLVFAVMSILVAVFTWIYLLDRGREFGLCLVGWSAICIHFSAPLTAHFFTVLAPLSNWITVVALVVAGTFFRLSVSEVFQNRWQQASYIVFVTLAAILYYTGWVLSIRSNWFYVALLSATGLAVLEHGIRTYGLRSRYMQIVATVLLPYWAWTVWQATQGHHQHGMDLYLFGLFTVTGMAYLQRFRRLTPGVVCTVAAFIAWGLVFPLSTLLGIHDAYAPRFLWNLPTYFVAFGMIVTLLENQTEVATSKARQYQALFEGNMAGMFVVTPDGVLVNCNRAFLKMHGFDSKEEALAISMPELYVDPSEWQTFLTALDRDGQVLNHECRQRGKNGLVIWHLTRASIFTGADGSRLIEGTAVDITERKQAEIALKQSEERFAAFFRGSPLACAIVTLNGTFQDVNESMLRTLARPAESVIGRNWLQLGLWKSQQARDQFFQRLLAEGTIHNLEVDFKDATGRRHVGLYFATLVRIADKQCIFGMMLDQTETRELEARFLESQKMEALGRLAGGVAHDFNNLLGAIGGFAELLEAKLWRNDDGRRCCTKIIDATQRASGLTRQLLTFSRKEVTRPSPLHPGRAFRVLAGLIPRLIGEHIELSLNLSARGAVVIDKTHFEQIVFNIVINSRDAMPDGGTLFIETEDVCRPTLLPTGAISISPYLAIRIRDTGSGMDEATRLHAFEPFYTTKDLGGGTGLGLATVYGIVQQSGGEITIDSHPGLGTQINIFLPALSGTNGDLSDSSDTGQAKT
jgi:PAS domain S-box-containing protein